MIMIELEALNWSFQLLLYIYNMISGMSRADVKNVLLIMHAAMQEFGIHFSLIPSKSDGNV